MDADVNREDANNSVASPVPLCLFHLRFESVMYPSNRHRELHKRQKGKCYYCHREMLLNQSLYDHPKRACTVDHKVPRARGGARGGDNIVGACGECNTLKGCLTDREFMAVLESAGADRVRLRELAYAEQSPQKMADRLEQSYAVSRRMRIANGNEIDRFAQLVRERLEYEAEWKRNALVAQSGRAADL
jgi:hypothetical protein